MIASLHGTPGHVGLEHVVLVVGGVGMRVTVTPATAASLRVGTPVTLSTTLVVREDSLTLYGFESDDARDLFETVQSVSGIGPRMAMAMLAVHAPTALVAALATGDIGALTKVPGIGKKSAERLVLELKDKVAARHAATAAARTETTPGAATPAASDSADRDQVVEALVGLGWAVKQAETATDRVLTRSGDDVPPVSALLRQALQELAK